jgi:hypothetical protein
MLCVFVSFGGAWTCWYPNGFASDNVGMAPCNATLADTTQGSACCDPRDSCTTSGMCLGESTYTYRGGCTDKTFASNNCPSLCHTDPITQQIYETYANIYSCGPPGLPSGTFCCGSYADPPQSCCATNFSYSGSGFAFRPGHDAEIALISSASVAIATATANSSSASNPSSGSTSSSGSQLCSPLPDPASKPIGGIVGGVVGGIAVLTLAAVVSCIIHRRSRRRRFAQLGSSNPAPEVYVLT